MHFPIPLFTDVPNVPVFLTHIVAPHFGPNTAARSSGPDKEASIHETWVTIAGCSRILRTISVGVGPTEVWSLTQMPPPVDVGMIGAPVAGVSIVFLLLQGSEQLTARE